MTDVITPNVTEDIALKANGLIKAFGGLIATDNLSLSVATGEIHAVIGPNGAGNIINSIGNTQ